MGCFTWVIFLAGAIFVMLSLIRWFEQINEAVRLGWWSKTLLLVIFPFSVWFFRSTIAAGRPSPVALHDPVRGFGKLPRQPGAPADDQPPPGTPPEFLVKPTIPAKKPGAAKKQLDPEKLAKLKQKMKDQGMLGDGE